MFQQLKAHLFKMSFPDYMMNINLLSPLELAVVLLLRPPKSCRLFELQQLAAT